MRDFNLTPRLKAIAELAADGNKITDVGTDHGYIPVWLALCGHAETITATDIKREPIQSAMRSSRKYGVFDRIRFVHCDGLCFDGARDTDTVIIAGMGGETIISILERAGWTKSGVKLLLQPQSKTDELCLWLAKAGYKINGAVLTEDAGRIYVVLSAVGTGDKREPVYAEDVLRECGDPLLHRWLEWRISVLKKSAEGISQAKDPEGADIIFETLGRLENAREEAE
ncbi:MAG: SAM-dependent methyltransferase [Clostridia bacterium]|nr:SAM-dependent methyltransferase [Clostridia bacterium]NCC68832.1 SAM-dependent methyltransferase [Clostridia bacterium]